MTDASQTVAEWTQDNLQPLIDKFNDYLITTGKSYQLTLNGSAPTVKGFFQQGAIVVATEVWARLCEFAGWVVDEYAVTDNQAGVALGVADYALALVPYTRNGLTNTRQEIMTEGLYIGESAITSVRDVYTIAYRQTQDISLYAFAVAVSDGFNVFVAAVGGSAILTSVSPIYSTADRINSFSSGTFSQDGVNRTYYYTRFDFPHNGGSSAYLFNTVNVPVFDTFDGGISALFRVFDSGVNQSSFSGITADTSVVSIPDELPESAEWGGLMVEGAQDVASPSAVEDVIESAIQARDKPVVRPATVTVPEGTEIDPDNGDATPPIVLTPFPLAPPSSMELADDIVESLKSHFPFSIPWDLYNLASAINAEPVAPTFRVSTPQIGEMSPVSFELDIGATAFDDYAYVFRAFTGLLICVWLLIGASKFIRR